MRDDAIPEKHSSELEGVLYTILSPARTSSTRSTIVTR